MHGLMYKKITQRKNPPNDKQYFKYRPWYLIFRLVKSAQN